MRKQIGYFFSDISNCFATAMACGLAYMMTTDHVAPYIIRELFKLAAHAAYTAIINMF
jgi:hypothetical protein